MGDIRTEEREDNTALNPSFSDESELSTREREPAAAIRRSIYTSDVDNYTPSKHHGIIYAGNTTHGVLHVIDSTGERQPMHIWLGDIKLWTMAVDHIRTRSKDNYDTFEFTPFSSAQNWDKIHPELKITGFMRHRNSSPKKQQKQKQPSRDERDNVLDDVLDRFLDYIFSGSPLSVTVKLLLVSVILYVFFVLTFFIGRLIGLILTGNFNVATEDFDLEDIYLKLCDGIDIFGFSFIPHQEYCTSALVGLGNIFGMLHAAFKPKIYPISVEDLAPGQTELMRWKDEGSIVQDYAARVGLPPTLIPTLTAYAEETGLMEIMKNMLYDDPLEVGGVKLISLQSPYEKGSSDEKLLSVQARNGFQICTGLTQETSYIAHEDLLRALAKGGFDQVLNGIGKKMGLDTLNVDSIGFMAVTNCEAQYLHHDFDDVDGKAFHLLLRISNPEDAGPELMVASGNNHNHDKQGEIGFGPNSGVLLGDRTYHATRQCDHRHKHEVRITVSIWLSDLTTDLAGKLASSDTSIFPLHPASDWVWAQRGRHWSKNDGRSLMNDIGREPFNVVDEVDGCKAELCNMEEEEGDGWYRNKCAKTCKVYMDDGEYKPGTARSQVYGY
ncbi:hypothetical protein ACHAWC_005431 [Mediolabrus comicus]